MSRDEKLQFIKEKHAELYQLLKQNVPGFVEDVWTATVDDISLYNSWVSFYCGQIPDEALMLKLLLL